MRYGLFERYSYEINCDGGKEEGRKEGHERRSKEREEEGYFLSILRRMMVE